MSRNGKPLSAGVKKLTFAGNTAEEVETRRASYLLMMVVAKSTPYVLSAGHAALGSKGRVPKGTEINPPPFSFFAAVDMLVSDSLAVMELEHITQRYTGLKVAAGTRQYLRFTNLEAIIDGDADERSSWNAVLTQYGIRSEGQDDEVARYMAAMATTLPLLDMTPQERAKVNYVGQAYAGTSTHTDGSSAPGSPSQESGEGGAMPNGPPTPPQTELQAAAVDPSSSSVSYEGGMPPRAFEVHDGPPTAFIAAAAPAPAPAPTPAQAAVIPDTDTASSRKRPMSATASPQPTLAGRMVGLINSFRSAASPLVNAPGAAAPPSDQPRLMLPPSVRQ